MKVLSENNIIPGFIGYKEIILLICNKIKSIEMCSVPTSVKQMSLYIIS